ncbi:type II secretion system major pseudopilin GspG [Sphingomonas sp. MMS12-HWE2-04]|uniref:type II secretion system major pseudopilin GspG n=1 Tax=Sphingomonas sp. MMS12-HWE2-04 TaxID=3234199 RepID=UPI00384E916C
MKQFGDIAPLGDAGKRRPVPNGEQGFTLLEVMIVLIIIAVLAGLVAVNVMGRPDEARATATKTNLSTIQGALKIYRLDNGNYPTTEQGLKALSERPTAPPAPTSWPEGGYLSTPAADGWGKPYEYNSDGSSFTIRALGKDAKPGGEGINADVEVKG